MSKNKDQVKTFLSSDFKIINNWFYENFMVLNLEKSYFLCIGQKIDDAKTKRSVKNLPLPRSRKESFIIQVNDKISV